MTVICYFCNVKLPSIQAKKCGRCLLVTYCSKECQAYSWKATHKVNCIPNPNAVAGGKPKKFSKEWLELEDDKLLSKWTAEWRECFIRWATIALDLPNHPPNRGVTHCLHIVVEQRRSQTKSYKNFIVVDAAVVSFSQIKEKYPGFATEIDPTDLTRFRYVLRLQDTRGEVRRVRILQWAALGPWWNKLPKDCSAGLAEGAVSEMKYSVEHMAPDIIEKKLGLAWD